MIAYLESDLYRTAMDIWNLRFESHHHEFYVVRDRGAIKAHLGIFHTPEADYVTLGGHDEAVGPLLTLIPGRAVVLVGPPAAFEAARPRMKPGIVYPNDLIMRRGEETLGHPGSAVRLTEKDAEEYAGFGASSTRASGAGGVGGRERISRDAIFGVFDQGKLVSVASAMAFHPEVAVHRWVWTQQVRRRGYGRSVVSAAVREALDRSRSCTLWVAFGNAEAQPMYRGLGFRKVGEELFIDIGTGVTP